MIRFDPNIGFSADSTSEIRAAIVKDWEAIFSDENATLNTTSPSPAGQLIDSLAVLLTAKDSEFLYLANQFNPLTAEGVFQDALGAIYFLTRKTDESSIVSCDVKGLPGTVIPAGSLVQTVDGQKLTATSDITIGPNARAVGEFAALEPGPLEIAPGAVNKIVTVIAGWDSVTNPTAGTPGRYMESRADFENRRYLSVAANAHGTVLALTGSLYNLPGVLDCLVLENKKDISDTKQGVDLISHSVAICIYGGDGEDIARAIYNKLDAGCGTNGNEEVVYISEDEAINKYMILRPAPVPVYVQVVITRSPDLKATVIEDIKRAILNDAAGLDTISENIRIGMGQTIYAARFTVAIVKTAGVPQLQTIAIGLSSTTVGPSVSMSAAQEPIITEDTIKVDIQDAN